MIFQWVQRCFVDVALYLLMSGASTTYSVQVQKGVSSTADGKQCATGVFKNDFKRAEAQIADTQLTVAELVSHVELLKEMNNSNQHHSGNQRSDASADGTGNSLSSEAATNRKKVGCVIA